MSLPIVLLSGADDDLQQLFNKFEDYKDGFGEEFLVAVDAYRTRIGEFPEIAPVYLHKDSATGSAAISIRHFLRTATVTRSCFGHSRFAAG